jgi:hypothetical protein
VYDAVRGEKLALTRALATFPSTLRTRFWEAYWTRTAEQVLVSQFQHFVAAAMSLFEPLPQVVRVYDLVSRADR